MATSKESLELASVVANMWKHAGKISDASCADFFERPARMELKSACEQLGTYFFAAVSFEAN